MTWALGRTSPDKVVHRADCRYGKQAYIWAGERSTPELVAALKESGGYRWHRGGRCCAPYLDDLLLEARGQRRELGRLIRR